jgi:hypothetical protein
VETLSGGRLEVRSLRDPEVRALLDRARPGWRWEPMLLEIEGEHIRVFTGLAMRWRLVQLLGPVRALRVAQVVARHGGPVLGVDWERRRFLGRALGALTGWIALRGLGRPVPVGIFGVTHGPLSGAGTTTGPVGSEASSQGVVAVEVESLGKDKLVFFKHRIPSRSGELMIRSENEPDQVSMMLSRNSKYVLSLKWDPINKEVWLSDSSGAEGHFKYDTYSHQWISVKPDSLVILNRHRLDVQIIAAIYADLTEKLIEKSKNITDQGYVINVYCPCTGPWYRGEAVASTRSWCCYYATNNVNVKCWNNWCIGCCQLLECDAACLIGEYFCVCGRSGRACGGPCY